MINLLEDNQKQQCFTLLPCAVGIVLLILTGLFAIFTHVLLPDMLDLWDFPTLLIYIGICYSLVLLSGKRHKQEIIHFLRRNFHIISIHIGQIPVNVFGKKKFAILKFPLLRT